MQRNEPGNLLRLSTALKIFCGSSVKLDLLPRAETLLQEYLLDFKQVTYLFANTITDSNPY